MSIHHGKCGSGTGDLGRWLCLSFPRCEMGLITIGLEVVTSEYIQNTQLDGLYVGGAQQILGILITSSPSPNNSVSGCSPILQMNILRLRAVDGGAGNEFQNQWLSESGPFHFTGFSDFATRRVPKEEGKPPPQPCLASSECFVMAPSLRNQLGPRVLSCKCGFWVRMVIRQMGTVICSCSPPS